MIKLNSEIRLKKPPNSNFARHVLENNHTIDFNVNNDLRDFDLPRQYLQLLLY